SVQQVADKQGVRTDGDRFSYLKAQARDHALLEVAAALTVGLKREGGEFVDRAAGLVAALVDDLVFRLLGPHGARGGDAPFERRAGGGIVIQRQGELGRAGRGDLMQGVDDAAVVFAALRVGNQRKAVVQLFICSVIHNVHP